jgi:hypothetical protein
VVRDIQHYMRPGLLQLTSLPPLSLYVHLPWCLKKCPYCDFNSHERARGRGGRGTWCVARAALHRRPDGRPGSRAALVWGRSVHSIFIGGGTPSLFRRSHRPPDRRHPRRLPLEADCEITLEANPGTFEKDRFRAFRAAGVTRLSVGVQSFNDRTSRPWAACTTAPRRWRRWRRRPGLRHLQPRHHVRAAGPDAGQSWSRTCHRAALAPPHISIYHLTIEPNTYFAKFPPAIPRTMMAYAMLDRITEMTGQAGLARYEISAYASRATSVFTTPTTGSLATTWALARARTASSALPTAWCARTLSRPARATWTTPWQAVPWRRTTTCAAPTCRLNTCSTPCACARALRCRTSERTGLPLTAIAKALDEAERKGLIVRDMARVRPTERGFDFLSEALCTGARPGRNAAALALIGKAQTAIKI